jgi:hypothetical protein
MRLSHDAITGTGPLLLGYFSWKTGDKTRRFVCKLIDFTIAVLHFLRFVSHSNKGFII